jgi:hypothetical protein
MFQIVTRQNDLAEVGGFAFASEEEARACILKRAGLTFIKSVGTALIKVADTRFGPFRVYVGRSQRHEFYVVPVGLAGYAAMHLTSRCSPNAVVEFDVDLFRP